MKLLIIRFIKRIIVQVNQQIIKLTDYFEPLYVKTYQLDKEEKGKIPIYGATNTNQPIGYINNCSIDSDKPILCINKTGNGGAGLCYLRSGKFSVTGSVMCCKLKKEIDDFNVYVIGQQLHKIFNRSNNLNLSKFKDISVEIYE